MKTISVASAAIATLAGGLGRTEGMNRAQFIEAAKLAWDEIQTVEA